MFEVLRNNFIENVLSSYNEYDKYSVEGEFGSSKDIRLALTCATNLYHFREHLPVEIKITKKQSVQICEDFNILGDIVNTAKHQKVTRTPTQIEDAKSIYEVAELCHYNDGKSPYTDCEKKVYIKLKNGIERDIKPILVNVLNMWITILRDNKVISMNNISNLKRKFPVPRSEARQLNLRMMKGEGYKFQFRYKRYDLVKKESSGSDISKNKIRFSAYKVPNLILSAVVESKKEGVIKEIEIPLNEEQSNLVREAQDEYLLKLIFKDLLRQHLEQNPDLSEEYKEFV